jgi:hypothetical protein
VPPAAARIAGSSGPLPTTRSRAPAGGSARRQAATRSAAPFISSSRPANRTLRPSGAGGPGSATAVGRSTTRSAGMPSRVSSAAMNGVSAR